MVLIWSAVFALQAVVTQQTPRDFTKDWEALLKRANKKVERAIMFDVDSTGTVPPKELMTAAGSDLLTLLASVSRREWHDVDGFQVFIRSGTGDANPKTLDSASQCFKWINSLSEEKLQKLASGKLTIDDMSPEMRGLTYAFACYEPNIFSAFAQAGSNIGVGVSMSPKVVFTDPKTGKKTTRSIPVDFKPVTTPTNLNNSSNLLSNREKLKVEMDGPLDFGEGSILPLRQIVIKAQDVFGVFYRLDDRIKDKVMFICGKHSKPTFEKAIRLATMVPPVEPLVLEPDHDNEIANLLKAGLRGLLEGKYNVDIVGKSAESDASFFGDVSTNSAGQLTQMNAALGGFLTSMGLDTNSQVTIVPGLSLIIDAGGESVSANSRGAIGGVPVPVYTANRLSLGVR